jgi:hypothetical protein
MTLMPRTTVTTLCRRSEDRPPAAPEDLLRHPSRSSQAAASLPRCVLFDVLTAPVRLVLGTGSSVSVQRVDQPKKEWDLYMTLPGLLELSVIVADAAVILPAIVLGNVLGCVMGRNAGQIVAMGVLGGCFGVFAPLAIPALICANVGVVCGIALHNAMLQFAAKALDIA